MTKWIKNYLNYILSCNDSFLGTFTNLAAVGSLMLLALFAFAMTLFLIMTYLSSQFLLLICFGLVVGSICYTIVKFNGSNKND